MEQPDLPPSYADYVERLTESNLGAVLSERTESVSFAFEHCQQRISERYDPLVLGYETWQTWNQQIQNQSPEVFYLTPALRGSSYWCVWLENTPILAVYRKRVVTVLPKKTWFVEAVNEKLMMNLESYLEHAAAEFASLTNQIVSKHS
jgi:hypothetical protein